MKKKKLKKKSYYLLDAVGLYSVFSGLFTSRANEDRGSRAKPDLEGNHDHHEDRCDPDPIDDREVDPASDLGPPFNQRLHVSPARW